MQPSQIRWRDLFLLCFGIAISSTFIMQWLATDFWIGDEKFSIFGLELFYSKRRIIGILTQIKQPARIALNYQLIFDFAFMTGVYPGIACLCMLAREKIISPGMRNILFALAMLQPVAWAFDVVENTYLMSWVAKPQIGAEFGMYHNIVAAKWLIALSGAITAIGAILFTKQRGVKRYSSS